MDVDPSLMSNEAHIASLQTDVLQLRPPSLANPFTLYNEAIAGIVDGEAGPAVAVANILVELDQNHIDRSQHPIIAHFDSTPGPEAVPAEMYAEDLIRAVSDLAYLAGMDVQVIQNGKNVTPEGKERANNALFRLKQLKERGVSLPSQLMARIEAQAAQPVTAQPAERPAYRLDIQSKAMTDKPPRLYIAHSIAILPATVNLPEPAAEAMPLPEHTVNATPFSFAPEPRHFVPVPPPPFRIPEPSPKKEVEPVEPQITPEREVKETFTGKYIVVLDPNNKIVRWTYDESLNNDELTDDNPEDYPYFTDTLAALQAVRDNVARQNPENRVMLLDLSPGEEVFVDNLPQTSFEELSGTDSSMSEFRNPVSRLRDYQKRVDATRIIMEQKLSGQET